MLSSEFHRHDGKCGQKILVKNLKFLANKEDNVGNLKLFPVQFPAGRSTDFNLQDS